MKNDLALHIEVKSIDPLERKRLYRKPIAP